jgi:hypothetical protein
MFLRTVMSLAVAGLLLCMGLVGCSESSNRVMSSDPGSTIGTGLSTGLVESQGDDSSVDGFYYPDYYYTDDEPTDPGTGDTFDPPEDGGGGGDNEYTLYGRTPN